MNHAKRIREQAAAIAALTMQVRDRLPAAIEQLRRELDELDGYPSTASGADRQRGGTAELTSVEAAAHARLGDLSGTRPRLGASSKLEHIESTLGSVAAELGKVLGILDALVVAPVDPKKYRCIGDTGEPHSYRWCRPECSNIQEVQSRHGLCVSCRQRRTAALREIEAEQAS
jgi:hypothetical protein